MATYPVPMLGRFLHMNTGPSRPLSALALSRPLAVTRIQQLRSKDYKLSEAIEIVSDDFIEVPDSEACSVTPRTLYRWQKRYSEGGVEALENKVRAPLQGSRVFSDELLNFVISELDQDPVASVPELIRRARLEGYIAPDHCVIPGSLWRVLRRMGVDFSRKPGPAEKDMRRFAHKERMQCVMVDGKHFRVGSTEAKRVVLYYLDDATRFGLGTRKKISIRNGAKNCWIDRSLLRWIG